jgi:hypothetical protein
MAEGGLAQCTSQPRRTQRRDIQPLRLLEQLGRPIRTFDVRRSRPGSAWGCGSKLFTYRRSSHVNASDFTEAVPRLPSSRGASRNFRISPYRKWQGELSFNG